MDFGNAMQTRVRFILEPEAPTATETLWATPLGDSQYQVDNAPWYARGVAAGDVILCREEPGDLPTFHEVVHPSGNLTARVFVRKGPERAIMKERVFKTLKSLGCSYEGMAADKGLIAVTIPTTASRADVVAALESLEQEEVAYWEAANF